MKRFDILTIFPELFEAFANESLLKKAHNKKLLAIRAHNLRDWSGDAHKTVDDKPFGGGLGMVLKVEPFYKAVKALSSEIKPDKRRVILFSPRGKKFNQRKAFELLEYDQLILICGRYEGIDERVKKYIADETISLGDFDLMGGEVPAMALIECVSRLIPGVIGKPEFLQERIAEKAKDAGTNLPERAEGFVEYPQYTRPEVFEPEPGIHWKVPDVLRSGNHEEIKQWRTKHRKIIR